MDIQDVCMDDVIVIQGVVSMETDINTTL